MQADEGDNHFEELKEEVHNELGKKPQGYLLIHNVSKDKNVGMLVR